MSDNELTVNEEPTDDIPCMLLPLVGSTVLLPTVTVAEMAPMMPVQDVPNTPEWFEGYYFWRDQKVPLISYEHLNGKSRYPLNPLGRVAVLNGTGVNSDLPFVAFATQGIPKMTRIKEENILANDEIENLTCETMHVLLGVDDYVIPNVALIEREVVKVLDL